MFICLLAGSSIVVTTIFLALRFPPLLFAAVLSCVLLAIILRKLRGYYHAAV